MKQVCIIDLTHAAPVDRRGKRTPETLQALARRDALLHEARARFCAGLTHHQAAELLHTKLRRYQTSAWRRERGAEQCPSRLAGREGALLWQILRAHDHVLGAPMIAKILSRAQQ
jgi:hypothetical protein